MIMIREMKEHVKHLSSLLAWIVNNEIMRKAWIKHWNDV
jgi:hypothetical protein